MSDEDVAHRSRRDFLKRSAVAGAVVWAAPAVTSIPAGRAWSQTYEEPCVCTASGFGLRIVVPLLGIDQTYDTGAADPPVLDVDTGVLNLPIGTLRVQARVITANDGVPAEGGCHATASLAGLLIMGTALPLLIRPIRAATLASEAHARCDDCNTGGASVIAGLQIGAATIPVGVCNLGVAGVVTVNEEFCADGMLNVNALHVNIPGVVEIIVAHTEAGATNCSCVACQPG
jgi:hypothetical protein